MTSLAHLICLSCCASDTDGNLLSLVDAEDGVLGEGIEAESSELTLRSDVELKPVGGGTRRRDAPAGAGAATAGGGSQNSRSGEEMLSGREEVPPWHIKGDQMTDGTKEAPRFVATLAREFAGEPLGLHLDRADSRQLHVCAVRPGSNPAMAYNSNMPKPLQLRAGDYILSVNGIRGDNVTMLQAADSSTRLDLLVGRAMEFEACISNTCGRVGLGLSYTSEGRSLVVETVFDGPVQEWNAANADRAVTKGDRIVAVNGMVGTQTELLHALKSAGSCTLRIARPAPTLCEE